jgi:hypothetical protein
VASATDRFSYGHSGHGRRVIAAAGWAVSIVATHRGIIFLRSLTRHATDDCHPPPATNEFDERCSSESLPISLAYSVRFHVDGKNEVDVAMAPMVFVGHVGVLQDTTKKRKV